MMAKCKLHLPSQPHGSRKLRIRIGPVPPELIPGQSAAMKTSFELAAEAEE